MSLRRVRRRCEALVREIDLPMPFDVETLSQRVSERRGRRIRLVPRSLGHGPCGIWVALPDTDYIYFEDGTTRLHREHIVLHELVHVLADHAPSDRLDEDLVRLLMPGLDYAMVRRALGRTTYSAVEEQEAEVLATLILERARKESREARRASPEVAAVLDRLENTLRGRAG